MVPPGGRGTLRRDLLGMLCITRGDRPVPILGCLPDPGQSCSWGTPPVPLPRDGDSSSEIMQLDFEMENFTSQSVTRRIMWHIDYRGRNPPPDLEKVVTELTVIQRDIRAIVPLAMVSGFLPLLSLSGLMLGMGWVPLRNLSLACSTYITHPPTYRSFPAPGLEQESGQLGSGPRGTGCPLT